MKTKTPYAKLLLYFSFFTFLILSNGVVSAQRQHLLLEATFEGSNPFGAPLSLAGHQYCCSYSLTQSSDHARAGTYSAKFDLRKSDPSVSSSYRSEVETSGVNDSPTEGERWYGGSWFLPAPWTQDGFSESLLQWHDDDNTTPPFAILCHDGHIWARRNINGAATNYDLGLVTSYQGNWMDIVIHIKWTVGNTGFIQVWMNGTQKLNVSNLRTNSNGQYMKIGMNKFIWYDNPGSSTVTQRVFYVDEFRVGDELATYADVAPTTTSVPPTNQTPTANAGNNITVTLPTNSVTLVGSGTDADGTISSYAWSKVNGPATYTFGTPNAATTTVTNLVAGTYVFRLTVTDNGGATATDDVTVIVNPAPNQAPTANAGSDITVTLPTSTATLIGSGTDPDGTIASYAWTKVSGPAGNTPVLGTPNASTTTVSNLIAGTYVFRLTVTDNGGATATDNVTVTVNAAPNQPPTANAGSNIVITLPTNSTTLSGSGTDPDGTIANYAWTRVSGPTTFTLGTPNAASTTLTGLVAGTYTFRLTVTDNKGATATDDVTVTVNSATNIPPTANAGPNIVLTLPTNSTTLNGIGTDPDGTIASYAWTRVSGPTTFILGTPNAASTTLTGLVAGIYTFRLTVTDNSGATATDDVVVTVNAAANIAPTANAGANIVLTLPANSTTLNGIGVDQDGTISGYAWTRVSGPTTFTMGAPNAASNALSNLVQGVYVFRLTVTDNGGATATDDVTVTVNASPAPPNQSPIANAGANITITLPTNSTSLNGSGSTDPDGSISTWTWSWVSGPATYTIGTPNSSTTSLTGLVAGTYVFRITVKDNLGATDTDDVTITVNASPTAPNQSPIANAGANITITLPTNSTSLNGSGSTDPDGSIATWSWSWVSGPTTYTFGTPNQSTTSLTGLVAGTYVFRITVTDNLGAIDMDDVTVTVNASTNIPPIANAGANIVLTLPTNTTTLNGASSTDPDGSIATYQWTKVSGPSSYTIVSPNASSTSLNGLVQGVYIFSLTVTDNKGATNTDNVTVTVTPPTAPVNQAPVVNAGSDIIIMLPVNSVTLNGSATDADGTISSYAWTKISGPATFTLGSPSSASTALSNLVAGTYVFRLTVVDNMGASAYDNVTIVVMAAAAGNQPPVARTNDDITLTLPVNSTLLIGNSSTDPDGVIVSYKWTQVSGPSQASLSNSSSAATDASNLTTGIYTFELTVTDDKGATSTKTIKVTVNNSTTGGSLLTIYPNPSSGSLNFHYISNVNGKLKVTIYDMTKKQVKNEMIDKTQVSITSVIDLNKLRAGMYIIQISGTDAGTISKQFVKM